MEHVAHVEVLGRHGNIMLKGVDKRLAPCYAAAIFKRRWPNGQMHKVQWIGGQGRVRRGRRAVLRSVWSALLTLQGPAPVVEARLRTWTRADAVEAGRRGAMRRWHGATS